ncbi:MAG: ParB/RepB/Spo0J family partition protein [Desulfobulbaceae bacterium]|nr:ParB/RepB/Spo0J family partition protein [Desulfobulbaceae bacterium]
MRNGDRLGRGLQSLLSDSLDLDEAASPGGNAEFFRCPIDAISPNPYQPRKAMDDAGLTELAESIKEKGILQPLVVRKIDDAGAYELIAGERRLRAAKRVGLDEVPVIVKEATAEDRLELALIENIQRQNLNPVEEALAYRRLMDEFNLTQEDVSQKVGKDRSTVANIMRLLQLPEFVKEDIVQGRLSMGHARVLLSVSDPADVQALRDEIVQKGLSVRQVEKNVAALKKSKGKRQKTQTPGEKKPIPASYCKTMAESVARVLGTKSKIIQNGIKGKLEIEYKSLDDLERIHSVISKLQDERT